MRRAGLVAFLLHSGHAFSSFSGRISRGLHRQITCSGMGTRSLSATSSSSDDKEVVFVRHSTTYMNEFLGIGPSFGAPGFTDVFPEKERHKYWDTPLSPRGIELVKRELASRRPDFIDEQVDLVVVSPLRRALQTYDLGIRPHMEHLNVPVVALPHAAERLYLVSDIGSPVAKLEKEFPYVDFGEIIDREKPWWWTPASDYTEWRPTGRRQRYSCPGEPAKDFSERMQRLQKWLESRPEKKIVVVCHHGVIDSLLDMDFDNCQWRKVPFAQVLQKYLAEYE